MTQDEIQLLRDSFDRATEKSDLLIASFNRRLFSDFPHLRSLVPSQSEARAQRQIEAVRSVIDHLPSIRATYDAAAQIFDLDQDADSESVTVTAAAFLGALRETLGDAFSESVEAAWVACYVLISRQFPKQIAA